MTTSPSDVLEELALLEQSLEGMEWQDRKGKKQLPPIPGKQAGPLLQRVALAPKIDFDRGKMSQALAQLQDGMNNLLKGPTLSDIEASIDALAEDLQSDNVETITKSKSAEQHAPPTSLGQAQLANLDLLSPAPAPATGTDSKPSPATSLLGNLSFYSEPDTPVDHTTGPDSSMHSIQLESHQPNSLPLVVASQSTPAPLPPSLAPPAPTLVPDTPPVIVAPIVAAPPLAVSSVPPPAPIAASGTPSPAAQPAPEASPTPASVPVSPLPSTIQPESSISRPTLDDPEFWTTLPVLVSTPEVAPLPSTVQPESSMSHSHSPLDDPEFWMMPEDEEPSLVSTGMFSLESTWVPNVTISAVADTGAGAAEAPPQALDEFAEETPEEFSLDALLSSADPDAISDDQVFFNPGRFSQVRLIDTERIPTTPLTNPPANHCGLSTDHSARDHFRESWLRCAPLPHYSRLFSGRLLWTCLSLSLTFPLFFHPCYHFC
jgi:hypothetical protein